MTEQFIGYLFWIYPDFRSISRENKFKHEVDSSSPVTLKILPTGVELDFNWKDKKNQIKPLKVICKMQIENQYKGTVFYKGEEIEETVFFKLYNNGKGFMLSGEWEVENKQWSMVGEFKGLE